MFTKLLPLVAAILAIISVAGCAAPAATVNVSAAASLTDALKEVNKLYVEANPNVTVIPNFGGSGTLQKQIENGAPVDIFISAAAAQMDALQKEKMIIDDTRRNLLINKVVLIVPSGNPLGIGDFKDLVSDKVAKIAIGDPKSVPAGMYAQQIFDKFGISDSLKSKLVLGSDVRQVLTYVESGNVDAGIVFITDAKISGKVKIVANAPDDINAKVVYPVAMIQASKNTLVALGYESFLFSNQAIAVFEKYGFNMAGK
ncbi:MAG: molybdate ABC transporter substrate-binding protein [Dehalococcoidia bacterium]